MHFIMLRFIGCGLLSLFRDKKLLEVWLIGPDSSGGVIVDDEYCDVKLCWVNPWCIDILFSLLSIFW